MHERTDRRMRWPLRRFLVIDQSMEPTLMPGVGLIGVRWPRVRVGELRVLEHPRRPDFWLVKRVESVNADRTMTVCSDNSEVAAVDSRTFGPVTTSGSYRVIWRTGRSVTS